jgi:sigma-E factor negative regulatory protein RseB
LNARHIAIVPRDQYRYGQNIWLAEDTGLMLRAEVLDEQGVIVEQIMFTSLELLEHIPSALLQPQTENPGRIVEMGRAPQEQSSTEERLRWQVTMLPAGFRQDVERLHYLPNKSEPVEHHLYSDGLASVSVFIEKSDDIASGFTGSSRIGGVNAYGRRLNGHLAHRGWRGACMLTVKQIAECDCRRQWRKIRP